MKTLLAASAATTLVAVSALAQDREKEATLAPVVVTGTAVKSALTVPDAAQATRTIERTPGAVEVVPDTVFKQGPARTIKDVLGFTPGIFAQPRYGDDARVSIRGSGLSRSYGNRGVNVYVDGIPVNTSDGLVDLFEIDPTAYRYVEVFKGANALRYGGNSLGGAINFVTPTGRDASPFDGRIDVGSFGHLRAQASTGATAGPYDYFFTASGQRLDGFREHSNGHQERASGNFGYQFLEDAETRFYVNLNSIRQRLPGELTKTAALTAPRSADAEFERLDQQRNIDSIRLGNKTTLRFGSATVDLGFFGVHRHVMHPIYQWLDYHVHDYGGFVRATDEWMAGGFLNRLMAGVNVHNGSIDSNQFINDTGAVKGALAASSIDKSRNVSVYAENSLFLRQNLALIAGAQFQHSSRSRQDRFLSDGDQSGSRSYDNFSPKFGVLWDIDPTWQVFANLSRSAEVPTYDANTFGTPASSTVNAQTATTLEIGTRGRRPDFTWDLALYRAEIKNELQCVTLFSWSPCTVVNADRTVHQGIEASFGIAVLESAFANKGRLWFNAAYTYNDFFFVGDSRYGENQLPGVPAHHVRAELLYRHPNGFYAGPNIEWTPKAYFADNANQVTVDPYRLLNFKIGYGDQGAGWSGYLEGRNLLDARYIANAAVAGTADAASALFNPGNGRSIHGGMRFTW